MPKFTQRGKVRIFFNDVDISGDVVDLRTETRSEPITFASEGSVFIQRVPGPPCGLVHITAQVTDEVLEASNHPKENSMRNASTKEQVAVRTEMADLIKEAVEAKYGKVRTWTETETVGPLGGVSAQVYGAVEHEGKVVPFAVSIYSDDRIKEKLEEALEQEAEDGALRTSLGWAEG